MDIIHLLPDSVANQIAAGEVIQRPASCLKELVENSLDAGAKKIQVLVKDAGRTLLQVIDDGNGMSDTDLRMAFERHATSKIKEASDLFQLRTMGFRGEALASICAVAQIEVQSRRKDDEVGSRLVIEGSEVVEQEPQMCPVGTNFKVKNLFFNIPVRRKFLKTDQTELRNLLQEFYRIVLVYPKVQFTFVNNDEILLELPTGTEKQRIEAVFGKGQKTAFTSHFVDIQCDTELISIRGFVGKPEVAGKNAQQYFFVNGRYMRHPYFHKAVMTAYQGMLQGEANPSYFIYMEIDPEKIDVNIHPTKTEIKFEDEQPIFQIMLATVREGLGKFNIAPSLDFDREGYIEMPQVKGISASVPLTTHSADLYNPFLQSQQKAQNTNWQSLYARPIAEREPLKKEQEPLFEQACIGSQMYQYNGRYIMMPTQGGLMMIDQHRAHVCVLFETFIRQMDQVKSASQQLLFPEILSVDANQVGLVEEVQEDLLHIGFQIDRLDPLSFTINGVPAILGDRDPIATLRNILFALDSTGQNVKEEWKRKIALSLAKDTAIPYGKTLDMSEMEDLVNKLLALKNYHYTEDGKTVVSILTDDELAKKF